MTTTLESPRLDPTWNDLPEAVRGQVAGLLNRRLADALDLQTLATPGVEGFRPRPESPGPAARSQTEIP